MQELGPVEEVAAFFDLALLAGPGRRGGPDPIAPPAPIVP
jgi:hypothetical protein